MTKPEKIVVFLIFMIGMVFLGGRLLQLSSQRNTALEKLKESEELRDRQEEMIRTLMVEHGVPAAIPNSTYTLEISRNGNIEWMKIPTDGNLHVITDADNRLVDIKYYSSSKSLPPEEGIGEIKNNNEVE